MGKNGKKLSQVWLGLTGMLLSFVLLLGISVVEVSAVENYPYFDIGMNDSLSINRDFGNYYAYVRFCPPKTGAITFSITADRKYMAEVKLMKKNRSGKYVSVTDEYSEDFIENVNGKGGASTVTFAVKKGGKYALRVYLLGDFILNSRFKKASDAGGKKKSTAKALKKGKAQYGLLFMGKTQSRWYKIKAPNSKPMTIQFKGWGNGYMKYQIKVKGLGTVTREIYQNNWDYKKGDTTFRENNKIKEMKATLSKGTVAYIRVYNTHKRYGGYYMLKWK